MKTKGVIFDFGLTLFSFENPSVEKYMDCFRRGLLRSIETLKKENILTDKDTLIEHFTKAFNRERRQAFKIQRKTKEEYPCFFL